MEMFRWFFFLCVVQYCDVVSTGKPYLDHCIMLQCFATNSHHAFKYVPTNVLHTLSVIFRINMCNAAWRWVTNLSHQCLVSFVLSIAHIFIKYYLLRIKRWGSFFLSFLVERWLLPQPVSFGSLGYELISAAAGSPWYYYIFITQLMW